MIWANSVEEGFDISCKLSLGDNLHEMSKPISWEKYFRLLSAESFY